jgi:putative DNA primase/helicase
MRASAVEPKLIEWLWEPYIPLGKISVIAGQMGQGKSLLNVWLADYTTARGGGVLMFSAEDDAADTTRPRLQAVGANLDLVELVEDVTLTGARINELCDEVPNVQLVTVDPISAYMPAAVNTWKSQDVRLALEPIRQLAAARSIAVVFTQHLNRRSDGDPLARIADSQGVPQLARSVMVWGPDPGDPEGDHGASKALTRVKSNLARGHSTSATFTIVNRDVTSTITAPALERGLDAHIAAEDVIADRETRTARDEAAEWLSTLLADGPLPAKEVQRKAAADGISDRTLRRAKDKLGVASEQNRSDSGITAWQWTLSKSSDTSTYTNGHVGHVGHLGHVGQGKTANNAKASTYVDGPSAIDADAELSRIAAKFGEPV